MSENRTSGVRFTNLKTLLSLLWAGTFPIKKTLLEEKNVICSDFGCSGLGFIVRYQITSNRQKCLKSEQIVWISDTNLQIYKFTNLHSTVNVRKPNTFGFQTGHFCSVVKSVRFQNCLKSEQICSDFRQFCLSEIGTELFQTEQNVWISDTYTM